MSASSSRSVIYSMMVSLDGFVEGLNHDIGWHVVDAELHTFINEQQHEVDTYVFGRRMYEVMAMWDTVETDSGGPEHELEFARVWREKEKIVVSRTLDAAPPSARLAGSDILQELVQLRDKPARDIAVGGPGLAASLMNLGQIDEYRLFVHPVLLGTGTPFFPSNGGSITLRFVESHTFHSGVVYLRYRDAGRG